jgi:hypothetical protein
LFRIPSPNGIGQSRMEMGTHQSSFPYGDYRTEMGNTHMEMGILVSNPRMETVITVSKWDPQIHMGIPIWKLTTHPK